MPFIFFFSPFFIIIIIIPDRRRLVRWTYNQFRHSCQCCSNTIINNNIYKIRGGRLTREKKKKRRRRRRRRIKLLFSHFGDVCGVDLRRTPSKNPFSLSLWCVPFFFRIFITHMYVWYSCG